MKSITTISLSLSIIAVVLALWALVADGARAEAVVREREERMIERLKPMIHDVYRDFELALPASAENPQSLEDLFEPMLQSARPVASDD